MRPEDIIPDEDVYRVHGNANFGSMHPRDVINDGVRKYAIGFSGGSTQLQILIEHGLVKRPRGISYNTTLTEKGRKYARAIYRDPLRMKPSELIEMRLLQCMAENTPSEFEFGYYFPFRYLERILGLDREIVRGFCRSLRNRQLVEFGTGFTEDGFTAGGGYTLTRRGLQHMKALEERYERAE